MTNVSGLLMAAAGILAFGVACASSGSGGREVEITQTDDGCSPTSIVVTQGEKLNLLVKNESRQDTYEVEGIEGTKLEEVVVRKGKTLSVGYAVPSGAGVHKIKCYVPAGPSTIIELVANGGAAAPSASARDAGSPSAKATADTGSADTSVAVTLTEYVVTADRSTVKAGKIRFIATNTSATQVHELAVRKTKTDGSFDNAGEVEDIEPQKGGSIVLDLTPGTYQLACLITIGEAGSTVDHYQQGMHTAFVVQ